MKRRTMIEELSVGDTCEMDLLLLRMTQRTTKRAGNPYVELQLTDGSSIVTARKFNARLRDIVSVGVMTEMVVRVVLAVDVFMQRLNYIVCDIWIENYPQDYVKEFIPNYCRR